MTEQAKPKGTPYGMAIALLHESAEALPGAVVLLPDHVLWPSDSQALNPETFLILDEAAAVLSALHALHIPLVLLVPAHSSKSVQRCLQDTKLLSQFRAVVDYQPDDATGQQPSVSPSEAAAEANQQAQAASHQQQQQQQPQSKQASSSWMEAAAAVKAATGVPWQQTLMCCCADATAAVRLANKLGMACVQVPGATGLRVSSLQQGLETYASKLESDRGY